MRKNHIIIILCVLVVMLLSKTIMQPVMAQSSNLNPFLVSTYNQNEGKSKVWEVDSTNNISSNLWELPNLTAQPANNVLSPNELNYMNSLSQTGFIPANASTLQLQQRIPRVWRIDNASFLAEIIHKICFNTSGINCFGNSELAVVNTTINTITSIWKVDFHDPIANTWDQCLGRTVTVGQIIPNPTYNKVAMVYEPSERCAGSPQNVSTTIIVDYSTATVTSKNIPLANNITWSPDGNLLGFAQTTNSCPTTGCLASISYYNLATNTSTAVTSTIVTVGFPMALAWVDNQRLAFQGLMQGEGVQNNALLIARNLSGSQIQTSLQQRLVPNGLYLLNNNTVSNLFGQYETGQAQAFTVNTSTINVGNTFQPAYGIYDNPRYEDYVFLSQQQTSINQLLAVQASLQQTSVNLSSYLPSSESVLFVSPSGLSSAIPTSSPTNQWCELFTGFYGSKRIISVFYTAIESNVNPKQS